MAPIQLLVVTDETQKEGRSVSYQSNPDRVPTTVPYTPTLWTTFEKFTLTVDTEFATSARYSMVPSSADDDVLNN